MPSPVVTANMSLTEPGVGVTLSPAWSLLMNANMATIDQHNHTTGMGVLVPVAGLNINADLPLNSHSLTLLNSAVFAGAVSGTPAVLSLYSNGTDLFYKDINGNAIRLTQAGGPASGTGNIQGLPSTPTGDAGILWANAQSTFQLLQDSGTVGANLDAGTLIIRYPGSYPTPSGNYIALKAPTSLATGYSLTLPATLPAEQSVVQLSTSGQVSASPASALVPAGAILPFGGTAAPAGYLLCDGTSYLRATYPTLFTAIGTANGAADGTHFNVPDLRGSFPRGVTGSSGNDPDASSRTAQATGGNTGNNVGSAQASAFEAHNHSAASFASSSHFHAIPLVSTGAVLAAGTDIAGETWVYGQDAGTLNPASAITTSAGGSATGAIARSNTPSATSSIPSDGASTETRPINVYVNFIIKT